MFVATLIGRDFNSSTPIEIFLAKVFNLLFQYFYGIIIYKDKDGYDREIEFKNPISNKHYGKVIYLLIPDDFDKENGIDIEFNVRGNKYLYNMS